MIVTVVFAGTDPPEAGEVIVETGGVVSAEAVAVVSPVRMVAGWAPMSANRFTVACCIAVSGVVVLTSWLPSSPHDHCTVPAPNTSAPLAAR